MKNRSRDYYRKQRARAIERKAGIIKQSMRNSMPKQFDGDDLDSAFTKRVTGYWCDAMWHVKYKGMLSKGKIHCSCPMCSFHETPMQDKRNLERAKSELKDFYEGDEEQGTGKALTEMNRLVRKEKANKKRTPFVKMGPMQEENGDKNKEKAEPQVAS